MEGWGVCLRGGGEGKSERRKKCLMEGKGSE